MNKIPDFYENLNEIVYASDMDTYEILYMNRKARELNGFTSKEEYFGKKCYELLQGCSSPCAICTNATLTPGEFVEWKYSNPVNNRTYMVKDTMFVENGKRYRFEIAIDITEHEMQRELIHSYRTNSEIITEGLKLALSSPVPNEAIELMLEHLGKSLKSERVYIFEENANGRLDNSYEWCAAGIVPQKDNLQNIPIEDVRICYERFAQNETVVITDIEDIKECDSVAYEYLLPQEITSLVVAPLIKSNKIIGFFGVDNPPQDNIKNISTLLCITGHFLVTLLRSRNLLRKLEDLSFSDRLTGLGNRHAMDNYTSDMNRERSIGVVCCDITGLKAVNDIQGHHAGDELIVRAANSIKTIFPDYAKFRTGGDEFLILCSGITEDCLRERAARLRDESLKNSALMAVGCVWYPSCPENIDKLLTEADEEMYADKRNYYSNIKYERRQVMS